MTPSDADIRFLARRHLYVVLTPAGMQVRGHADVFTRLGIDPRSAIGDEADLVVHVGQVIAEEVEDLLLRSARLVTA